MTTFAGSTSVVQTSATFTWNDVVEQYFKLLLCCICSKPGSFWHLAVVACLAAQDPLTTLSQMLTNVQAMQFSTVQTPVGVCTDSEHRYIHNLHDCNEVVLKLSIEISKTVLLQLITILSDCLN